MQIFRTKTGLINIVIALLTVLMLAFMFIPSVTYEPGTEDEGTVSVYAYIFFPNEKPYKYLTDYMEDTVDPDYKVNHVYAEPMLLMVFCVVSCIICFAGYKNIISSLFPIVWGIIGLMGSMTNSLIMLSSWRWVYYGLAVAVLMLAVLSGALNLLYRRKD